MSKIQERPRVAFLGLGIMGQCMAARLVNAQFPLSVYNRTAAKSSALVALGATLGCTIHEAVEGADVIISMVADDAASRNLWLGPKGALAAAKSGAIAIESSTVSISWIRQLDEAARSKGCGLLDAPVTGSRPQAIEGKLKFLVGGEAQLVEAARPVFDAMGSLVVHIGAAGSGAALKLVNNFLVGVQAASLAEALAMIERIGLDPRIALETIFSGAVASPMMASLSNRIRDRDPTLNFPLRLMVKDLAYAAREAQGLGLQLKTALAAQSVFQASVDRGNGDEDLTAVYAQFRSDRH